MIIRIRVDNSDPDPHIAYTLHIGNGTEKIFFFKVDTLTKMQQPSRYCIQTICKLNLNTLFSCATFLLMLLLWLTLSFMHDMFNILMKIQQLQNCVQ